MKKITILFFTVVIFYSCNKGDSVIAPAIPPRVDETPLASVLNADSVQYNLAIHDVQAKELGYLFVPSKKGKIYAMGIRMPQAGLSYIVTLWDTLTHQVIKQKTIVNQFVSGFSYIDLGSASINEEIDVTANHAYIISVNTAAVTAGTPNRQWYMLSKKNGADFLPLAKGHIQILQGRYSSVDATTPTFPDKDNSSVFGLHLLFGLVDIGYYATEY